MHGGLQCSLKSGMKALVTNSSPPLPSYPIVLGIKLFSSFETPDVASSGEEGGSDRGPDPDPEVYLSSEFSTISLMLLFFLKAPNF